MKTAINLKAFGRDVNGNSLVKFSIVNNHQKSDVWIGGRKITTDKHSYGYSLQTMGSLPFTHNLKIQGKKVHDLSRFERSAIENEIEKFLLTYGSPKQKFLLQ